MDWDKDSEDSIVKMRELGLTYREIGEKIGTTENSVKHKIRRIQQDLNMDRYKHTKEKTEQARKVLTLGKRIKVLETHCGYGGMTEFYSNYFNVTSFDVDKKRVDYVRDNFLCNAKQVDSEQEIIKILAGKDYFDVIDVDPYGMPSRFFPYVFGIIKKGTLFLTFPKIGVAQINKITIRHYMAFWGISISEKDNYIGKITSRLEDYAFMFKREIKILDVIDLGRVLRMAISVEKKSTCDIVGLVVNRKRNA